MVLCGVLALRLCQVGRATLRLIKRAATRSGKPTIELIQTFGWRVRSLVLWPRPAWAPPDLLPGVPVHWPRPDALLALERRKALLPASALATVAWPIGLYPPARGPPSVPP